MTTGVTGDVVAGDSIKTEEDEEVILLLIIPIPPPINNSPTIPIGVVVIVCRVVGLSAEAEAVADLIGVEAEATSKGS